MTHHTNAPGLIYEVGFKTNQAAHRYICLDAYLIAVVRHIGDVGFPSGQILEYRSHAVLGNFEE